jgi:uncharacterized membrane protein YphA (DoxX/SURF4 family)
MAPHQRDIDPRYALVPPADPYAPSPRLRSLIALVLRLGLGLQVFNAGLIGYVQQGAPGGPGRFGMNSLVRLGIYPGSEPVAQFVPYVQIVVGLALMVGFLTAVAAVAAAFLALFPSIAEAFILSTSGLNLDPFQRQNAETMAAMNGAMAANLLLIAAVLWFSHASGNAWSLDGLMFARGASGEARDGRGSAPAADGEAERWPDPMTTAGPRPAEGPEALAVEFDPDVAVGHESPQG